ncbi:MAG TPA: hypothetical protein VGL81_21305 [Polyangiaceae bacterium]|jgi:hypothetical protein
MSAHSPTPEVRREVRRIRQLARWLSIFILFLCASVALCAVMFALRELGRGRSDRPRITPTYEPWP